MLRDWFSISEQHRFPLLFSRKSVPSISIFITLLLVFLASQSLQAFRHIPIHALYLNNAGNIHARSLSCRIGYYDCCYCFVGCLAKGRRLTIHPLFAVREKSANKVATLRVLHIRRKVYGGNTTGSGWEYTWGEGVESRVWRWNF